VAHCCTFPSPCPAPAPRATAQLLGPASAPAPFACTLQPSRSHACPALAAAAKPHSAPSLFSNLFPTPLCPSSPVLHHCRRSTRTSCIVFFAPASRIAVHPTQVRLLHLSHAPLCVSMAKAHCRARAGKVPCRSRSGAAHRPPEIAVPVSHRRTSPCRDPCSLLAIPLPWSRVAMPWMRSAAANPRRSPIRASGEEEICICVSSILAACVVLLQHMREIRKRRNRPCLPSRACVFPGQEIVFLSPTHGHVTLFHWLAVRCSVFSPTLDLVYYTECGYAPMLFVWS
jgi:hypothetical protein